MRGTRQLIFENGKQFFGKGFGAQVDQIAEAVLNTSMVGYQEILSDPAYSGQAVLLTYPLIGNYGLADDDFESGKPRLSALIVREHNERPSNFRASITLCDWMLDFGIPGIAGVDTRQIARMLRSEGAMPVLLTDADTQLEEGLARIQSVPATHDRVSQVSCKKPWVMRTAKSRFHVAVMDFGVKRSILRSLAEKGCNLTILPCEATLKQVLALRPDGLLLSGGPGNPEDLPHAAALARALQGKFPILGIGLGHQIIALASGAKVFKMKRGHRGGNQPIRDLSTGCVAITAQNHAYAVDVDSLHSSGLTLTHINILDGTAEGLQNEALGVFAMQYEPDSAPAPLGCQSPLDQFIARMEMILREVRQHYA